jgi:hypothetical protein
MLAGQARELGKHDGGAVPGLEALRGQVSRLRRSGVRSFSAARWQDVPGVRGG